jgi:hypothetical protein
MRFGTRLFAALVLAGTLANAARAQLPGASTATPGPYSVYGPGLTYRPDSSYTGPYSVYGPGHTYRQDPSSYRGPYYGRFSSASSSAPTGTGSNSSLRTAGLTTQTGKGSVLGAGPPRPDAGRAPAAGSGPGATRYRYVRISIAGNAIQAIVIP